MKDKSEYGDRGGPSEDIDPLSLRARRSLLRVTLGVTGSFIFSVMLSGEGEGLEEEGGSDNSEDYTTGYISIVNLL